MTRTSSGTSLRPPTRRKAPSSRTRSSFACRLSSISPISSRKMVPPSACSSRPCLRFQEDGRDLAFGDLACQRDHLVSGRRPPDDLIEVERLCPLFTDEIHF